MAEKLGCRSVAISSHKTDLGHLQLHLELLKSRNKIQLVCFVIRKEHERQFENLQ